MIFLVAFLSLVVGIFSFLRGNRVFSLLIFLFFLTGGYQLIPEESLRGFPISKFADFGLLYVLCLGGILLSRGGDAFAANDPVSRAIYILWGFMIFQLITTVFTGQESFGNAFKVFRQFFFFGIYFILRQLSPSEIYRVLQALFKITTVLVILYVLQVAFKIQILTGTIESAGSNFASSVMRYRNVPVFLDFFLVWLFFSDKVKRYRLPLIALFLMGFVIPMNRGPIIAFIAVSVLFLSLTGKVTSMLRYAAVCFSIGLVLWPFLSSRFTKEDTGGDLQKAFVIKNYQEYDPGDGGTFEFRVALLLERVDFLVKHPRQFVMGVGMNHEDSPRTQQKFKFFIGAVKLDEAGQYVMQQIDTTDLVWATLILRYGLLGLMVYFLIFFSMGKMFYKRLEFSASRVGLLLLGMYLVNSFAADTLIRPTTFFALFMCYLLTLHHSFRSRNKEILTGTGI